MNTKTSLMIVVALLLGAAGGYIAAADSKPSQHLMEDGSMMHGAAHSMQGEMDGMMAGLAGKTGDNFDRAFLAEMIVHHEGAVDMAEAALERAGHAEIREMAQAIIAAQTREIDQMKSWQQAWYGQP